MEDHWEELRDEGVLHDGTHKASAAADGLARQPSTPSRPPRSHRRSFQESTPVASKSSWPDKHSHSHAVQLNDFEPSTGGKSGLRFGATSQSHALGDSEQTPRKGCGIPTPPYSETTSSAGGSVGRARKDSDDPTEHRNASTTIRACPASSLQSARPPSAASSTTGTGSDTVGGRSPLEPQSAGRLARKYALTQPSASSDAMAAFDWPLTSSLRQGAPSQARMNDNASSILSRASSRNSSPINLTPQSKDKSPGSDRQRRSEMHTRDMDQIRSESRLGNGPDDDEHDENDKQEGDKDLGRFTTTIRSRGSGSRSHSNHKYSPRKSTYLSHATRIAKDTEGVDSDRHAAPSVNGSSAGTSKHVHQDISNDLSDTHARSARETPVASGKLDSNSVASPRLSPAASPETSRYASGVGDGSTGSMRRQSRSTGQSAGRRSLDAFGTATAKINTTHRSPLPAEFRVPGKEARMAYRAARAGDSSDSDTSTGDRKDSRPFVGMVVRSATSPQLDRHSLAERGISSRKSSLTHQEELGKIHEEANALVPSVSSPPRRRRYASDAAAEGPLHGTGSAADSLPTMNSSERPATHGSRTSIDVSSVQRYLNRGSAHSTPSSDGVQRAERRSATDSAMLVERTRKISTSSSRSQKSSNSASDLHRTASRVSMRRAYGRDPFSADDDLASHSHTIASGPRATSPVATERSSTTGSSERTRLLPSGRSTNRNRPRYTDDGGLTDLRSRIEQLHIGGNMGDVRHSLVGARSSIDTKSPVIGSGRAQSVLDGEYVGEVGNRTPRDFARLSARFPATDPQRSRIDRVWAAPTPDHSADAAQRIHNLVSMRDARAFPLRSSTSIGMTSEKFSPADPISSAAAASPRTSFDGQGGANGNVEPAPIRNMSIRLSQFQNLYSKVPSVEPGSVTGPGPQSARVVELMGAIANGTASMWSELSVMHPVAAEGHLMGLGVHAATAAFGQLDEGFAFLNKLVLEQARAIQDLLFLLDRMEKERQQQYNQALNELGHSPRPFPRVSSVAAGTPSASAEREYGVNSALRRSASSVRSERPALELPPSVRANLGVSVTSAGSPFSRGSAAGTRSVERAGTLNSSQLRSMTSLGHNTSPSHSRSASELSPSSAAASRRAQRIYQQQQQPSPPAFVESVFGDDGSSAPKIPPRSARERRLASTASAASASLTPTPTSSATTTQNLASASTLRGKSADTHLYSETDESAIADAAGRTSAAGAAASASGFAPRRPRLSNPSVSNATALYQPSVASSVVSSSPEPSIADTMG
ncbi:hypothetical protein BCV70DRAFT_197400 [Testicularia cyperi]|uniref:Uncharacterized protein n=1 Tax=Testicularia cyperi TaxID=1882483 RepID=A0A317XYF9_9BASI|nr:hypothetical protein BCV70DRAFT_197400 [Testicularia cyperi]